jgi:hypothetical protein
MKSPDMDSPQSPIQKRPLFTWRVLRRVVIVLAWTATIIALAYAVEDWRCQRAWEQFRAAAEARGEHLDRRYFDPKPVPDDENFFMAGDLPKTLFPVFHMADQAHYAYFKWNDRYEWAVRHRKPSGPGFHLTDLAGWEKALAAASAPGAANSTAEILMADNPDPASRAAAAPGVLREMEDCAPVLEELRVASSRPQARFPVEYDAENPAMIGLPYLSVLQQACLRLRLRAAAELALGRNIYAMQDLELILYLSGTIKKEPMLISGLVRIGCQGVENAVLMEGLAGHDWSDAQLQEIQRDLLSCNYVADLDHEIAAERAASVAIAEYYGSKRDFNAMIDDFAGFFFHPAPHRGAVSRALIWLMPRGWYHLEQINLVRSNDARFQSVLDPDAKRIFPLQLEANLKAQRPIPGQESVFDIMEPNAQTRPASDLSDIEALLEHRCMDRQFNAWEGETIVRRYAGAQCMADQGAIACGLERYLLAKGDYPANLDALVPEFLPALPDDVLTGEPYRYRRESAQKFTLYSVGWNLKDDGGKAGAKAFGGDGDWVW